mgnify:CR=1 FL=1
MGAGSRRVSLGDIRVAPRLLVDDVVQKLKEVIFSGGLRPGDRLVETDLSVSLGVSRPLLREAIRTLQAERLCVVTPHKGAHIPVLSWQDAEHIYDVRMLLEGEACALCAQAITQEELSELADALAHFGAAVDAEARFRRVEATTQFYAVILRASRNPVIEELLLGLLARVNFLRARSMDRPGRAKFSHAEMEDILRAIRERDAERAREAAIRHVRNAKAAAREAFLPDGRPAKHGNPGETTEDAHG